jgi:hypothetical protein
MAIAKTKMKMEMEMPTQPKGDEFIDIGLELGELVKEKNAAYGDSFSRAADILKILYPDGVTPEQYLDMLAVTRVLDKLFRMATRKEAFGESPWRDICGYAILGIANDEQTTKKYLKKGNNNECK